MLNGQQQEPYEGRSSRTVLWERRGEVPLRDPITPTCVRLRSRVSGAIRSPSATLRHSALNIHCLKAVVQLVPKRASLRTKENPPQRIFFYEDYK